MKSSVTCYICCDSLNISVLYSSLQVGCPVALTVATEYYTEGSLDEKSVTRIGSCHGGECLNALAKNFIPASA